MKRIVPVVLGVVMMAALLLPLMSVLGYGWNLSDMLSKLPRLLPAWQFVVVCIIAAAMVVLPLLVAVRSIMSKRLSAAVKASPCVASLLLVVLLSVAGGPVAPAYGLWLYVIAAALLFAISFARKM